MNVIVVRLDVQLWAESVYVILIHGMFKINYQMGKHHMNGVLKNSSVGLSYFLEQKSRHVLVYAPHVGGCWE